MDPVTLQLIFSTAIKIGLPMLERRLGRSIASMTPDEIHSGILALDRTPSAELVEEGRASVEARG